MSKTPISPEAQTWLDKHLPCEPPCDSYGVCSNCSDAKLFRVGYGFALPVIAQTVKDGEEWRQKFQAETLVSWQKAQERDNLKKYLIEISKIEFHEGTNGHKCVTLAKKALDE